ncbi:MAG: Ku protein [Streptomycetaceae bacterium]|nr:Ku protein [Streptomycetaceae bacterium]
MARAMWSGALSFGLVSMPIQLYPATQSHAFRFYQIQRGTSDRIRNKRVNERTGDEVPMDEIVKGYEVKEDEYLIVEPEELDEITPGRSKSLEITGFVDLHQVDPIFFDTTYYIAPRSERYSKAYFLLHEALRESNKAGIATVVMRNREYLVAVKPEGEVLALHTLHWADEVRDPRRELPNLPENVHLAERELKTAHQLIDALSIDWDPREYRDTYQEKVAELLQAKRTGGEVEKGSPPPESTNVIDLMGALQASVEQSKKQSKKKGEVKAGPKKSARQPKKPQGKAAEPRLRDLSKTELYQRASDAGIPGRSYMSRDELIKALSGKSGSRRTAKAF